MAGGFVLAAFLNLFLLGRDRLLRLPGFLSSMVDSLGFTRAQLTQGFLVGFVVAALLIRKSWQASWIDRLGSRQVIRIGIWW